MSLLRAADSGIRLWFMATYEENALHLSLRNILSVLSCVHTLDANDEIEYKVDGFVLAI